MATTTLFVEILVMGALAELWFAGVVLALLDVSQVRQIGATIASLSNFTALFATLALALTYAIGWALNFVARQLFNPLREKRMLEELFAGGSKNYDKDRAIVFQYGSVDVLRDLHLDRHIVRIARSNVLNFTLIAFAAVLNACSIHPPVLFLLIITCLAVAMLSYQQWRIRYKAYYTKIAMCAGMLRVENKLTW